jgi:hypothetical protein
MHAAPRTGGKRTRLADSEDEAPEEVPRRRQRQREPEGAAPPPRRRAAASAPPAEEEEEDEEGADEEGEEGEEEEEDEELAALKDVPFGQLQRLQSDGRSLGGGRRGSRADALARAARMARANKNRPVEMTSKRPVPLLLPQLQDAPGLVPPRKVGKDPRFEALSGDLSDAVFRKRYAFMFDEQLPEERRRLKAQMQARP